RAASPCGQHVINPGESLNIQSAKYPKKYPKNENCAWEIGCSSPKATIDLTCSDFNIHETKNCKNDYLSMYDDSNNYVTACGKTPPSGVVSAGNLVTIEFVSNDDNKRRPGFDCTVTCLSPPTTTSKPTTSEEATTTTAITVESTTGAEDSETTLSSGPTCECGTSVPVSRILGGGEADINEYPWQVAITPKRLGIPFCSATLLNSQFVVTAAHCVDSIPVEHYDLVFGEHDWMKIGRTFQRTAAEVIIHPDFNKATLDNDIAIIKLNNPVSIFTHPHIKPVCLPSSDMEFEGKSGVATGWGLTVDGGQASSSLQEVDVEIMSQSDCEAAYPDSITDKIMCAGGDGSDICQGDDGGPLVVDVDGRYVLAGITSQGDCARTSKPGVFTNVQSQIDWINSQLTSGKFCPVAVTTENPTTEAETDKPTTKAPTTKAPTTKAPTTKAPTTKVPTTKAPTALPGLPCACGELVDKTGDDNSLTSNPWSLNLYSGSSIFCSATYINTMNILTAAKCVEGRGLAFSIRGNEETFGAGLPRAITRTPSSVIVNGDLALIQLSTAFTMTAYSTIKPACLPSYNPNFLNKRATHSGYNSDRVNSKGGSWSENTVDKLLRFNPDGGASGAYCGKDLGGPIVSEHNGRMTLAGIGIDTGCVSEQDAAKVSDYYQWIFDNSQNGRFCSL
ncbi:unnamed protein product, partial [Meganyctiphanes norvegica]